MYYVYILANRGNTVLYIGVTGNLRRRLDEHRNGDGSEFTSRYKTGKLVYFEVVEDIMAALQREKQLKGWRRSKKNALIAGVNPSWRDLSLDW
ncbi:GIY-YIG nuclease family protein [Bifidobacterium pluvialisilvae]|uniref:GIY-YIG nuclease family protein n=1 Tax=Bifidobacterium pluvialisilvae TaxID=2834436 RepID=UPI0027E39FDF|nr:GIY-YIG nuclease family protein [Bifidobacterium pluvialisilvae]